MVHHLAEPQVVLTISRTNCFRSQSHTAACTTDHLNTSSLTAETKAYFPFLRYEYDSLLIFLLIALVIFYASYPQGFAYRLRFSRPSVATSFIAFFPYCQKAPSLILYCLLGAAPHKPHTIYLSLWRQRLICYIHVAHILHSLFGIFDLHHNTKTPYFSFVWSQSQIQTKIRKAVWFVSLAFF